MNQDLHKASISVVPLVAAGECAVMLASRVPAADGRCSREPAELANGIEVPDTGG